MSLLSGRCWPYTRGRQRSPILSRMVVGGRDETRRPDRCRSSCGHQSSAGTSSTIETSRTWAPNTIEIGASASINATTDSRMDRMIGPATSNYTSPARTTITNRSHGVPTQKGETSITVLYHTADSQTGNITNRDPTALARTGPKPRPHAPHPNTNHNPLQPNGSGCRDATPPDASTCRVCERTFRNRYSVLVHMRHHGGWRQRVRHGTRHRCYAIAADAEDAAEGGGEGGGSGECCVSETHEDKTRDFTEP